MTTSITIVGGGIAGIAAAESISRAHGKEQVAVTLLESRRSTGGRAGSFVDAKSGVAVDYCQHVAMGCCTNFIDLVTQLGIADQFERYDELLFHHPTAGVSRFRASRRLPAPFHLISSFGRLRYLTWRQKLQIARAVSTMMRTKPDALKSVFAGDWLRSHGQDESTIQEFWDVFLVSALGELTDRVGIASARKVMLEGFASHRSASDVWIPKRPLSSLFGDVAREILEARGVKSLVGQTVRSIARVGSRFEVRHGESGDTVHPDAVILAVPWHGLQRIEWNTGEILPIDRLKDLAAIPGSPITGLHLWFDRPITDRPHAVLVGTTAQWLFRDPTGQSESTDGEHYYQVVISASGSAKQQPKQALIDSVLMELRSFFPAAEDAQLLRSRSVTDPKSVFSISPDVDAIRPGSKTNEAGLFLAGDWVQTGWPSTMEGAVRSGRSASGDALHFLGLDRPAVTSDLKPGWLANWLIV